MGLNKRYEKDRPLTHAEMDANWSQIESWLAQKANSVHQHEIEQINGLLAALSSKLDANKVGVNNGVASLDNTGKVPLSQLPSIPPPPTAQNGMRFPQRNLTNADVGKVVVWKDGAVQLPEFTPEVPETSGIAKITYNTSQWAPPMFEKVLINISQQPNPDEVLELDIANNVEGYSSYIIAAYIFKASASSDNHIEIGITIEDTVDNIISKLDGNQDRTIGFEITKESSSSFSIEWRFIHFDVKDYDGNYMKIMKLKNNSPQVHQLPADMTVSPVATFNIKSLFDTVFLLRGIRRGVWNDFGDDNGEMMYARTLLTANPIAGYSEQLDFTGNSDLYLYMPVSIQEFKDGVVYWLEETESIESAHWEGDDLFIEFTTDDDEDELQLQFQAPNDPGSNLYSGLWNGFDITQEYIPAVPPLCPYPMYGVLDALDNGDALLSNNPILKFTTRYADFLEIEQISSLFDMLPFFVPDWEYPGELRPILHVATEYNIAAFFLPIIRHPFVVFKDNGISDNSFFGSLTHPGIIMLAFINQDV